MQLPWALVCYREKGRFWSFSCGWFSGGWREFLESTHFLTCILRKKKKKNLCSMPRKEILVLTLICKKENVTKFRKDMCMPKRWIRHSGNLNYTPFFSWRIDRSLLLSPLNLLSILPPHYFRGTFGPGQPWATGIIAPPKCLQPTCCRSASAWLIPKPLWAESRWMGCQTYAANAKSSLQCHSVMHNCQVCIALDAFFPWRKGDSTMGLEAPCILFLLLSCQRDFLRGQDIFLTGQAQTAAELWSPARKRNP